MRKFAEKESTANCLFYLTLQQFKPRHRRQISKNFRAQGKNSPLSHFLWTSSIILIINPNKKQFYYDSPQRLLYKR